MSFFSNRRQSQPENQQIERPKVSSTPITLTQQPIGFESVLGVHSKMEGNLESHANIRLDGEFTGTLKITGNVLVGEQATINADINGKNISIAGAVRGNVSGKKVQLLRTARVWGDITATALSTEEGAFIDGKISMTSAEPEPEETVLEPTEESVQVETVIPLSTIETDDADTAVVSRKEFNEQGKAEAEANEIADAVVEMRDPTDHQDNDEKKDENPS